MPHLIALHRYWMHADQMRMHFDRDFLDANWVRPAIEAGSDSTLAFWFGKPGIFMSYWYSGLYVVVEGWIELGLTDPLIDSLLASPNVKLLKRFRNGTFHFQRDYFDARFREFIASKDSVAWVRGLTKAFGDYLLRETQKV